MVFVVRALPALVAALVALAGLQAAAMTVPKLQSVIQAQTRDSAVCGCAVCPCVEAAPVRTIEGLEKLKEAKARAALPLGWRPYQRTEACPCPVPSPCQQDPCEPAPCPCRKPEFYFADLVNELGTDDCSCPKPKPCLAFPCDPVPPCPCRKSKKASFEPEMTDYKVVGPVKCVGPGPCLTPRKFHEPEYTKQLQRETPVQRVVKKLPSGGAGAGAGQAPAVTDKEAAATVNGRPVDTRSDVPQAGPDASFSSGSEGSSGADSGDLFFSDSEASEEEASGGDDESGSSSSTSASGSS